MFTITVSVALFHYTAHVQLLSICTSVDVHRLIMIMLLMFELIVFQHGILYIDFLTVHDIGLTIDHVCSC